MHELQRVFARCLLLLLVLTACAAAPENSHEVECRVDPPSEPVFCIMQYNPVCGCDGKTYGNACTARGAGISESTPGACDDPGAR